MPNVKQMLAKKGNDVWSIEADKPVFEALKLMAEKDVGALLVFREGNIVGILSERDYARKVVLEEKSAETTSVSEIMTEDVLVIDYSHSIEDCMALMSTKKIRHLPVLDGDELVGIISIGDVVNAIISEKQFVITQLENYIKGY